MNLFSFLPVCVVLLSSAKHGGVPAVVSSCWSRQTVSSGWQR